MTANNPHRFTHSRRLSFRQALFLFLQKSLKREYLGFRDAPAEPAFKHILASPSDDEGQ